MIEDDLLRSPGRQYALLVGFDLLLELVGDDSEWRRVAEDLDGW